MNKKEREPLKLTAKNVESVLVDCLLKKKEYVDDKPICDNTLVEGILSYFMFHNGRLKKHEEDIIDLVNQLPDLEDGLSFLELCVTKDGTQWGEHKNIEHLIVLGNASGLLTWYPREMWKIMPGGLPYIFKGENWVERKGIQLRPSNKNKCKKD